ncbi:MAG: aldo/keto reductase [Actinomycetota bacterium]
METRTIGSLKVSAVGLGCNNFGMRIDERATAAVVGAAFDAGVNFFDTADIYGATLSEEYLGRALGRRRSEAIVATKFGAQVDEVRKGARPEYITRAVEDSLRRLATDRIDLYQLHVPDADVPLADTLGALDELVRVGKVVEIGCSNFSSDQLDEAESTSRAQGWARFASVQNEYSLLRRGPERWGVLEACERNDVGFLPYFPLASGVLTGKYTRDAPPPEGTRLAAMGDRLGDALSEKVFNRVEALSQWSAEQGHSLLELAMSWLLTRPAVASVIAGATKPEQVRANVDAAGWKLTDADLATVDSLLAAAG